MDTRLWMDWILNCSSNNARKGNVLVPGYSNKKFEIRYGQLHLVYAGYWAAY